MAERVSATTLCFAGFESTLDRPSHTVTANATSPIEILGRFNWAADWIVEFAWSVRTGKPTATTRRVDILDGVFVNGVPNPPDTSSRVVVARSLPTANKQDEDAVNAIFNRRRAALLRESGTGRRASAPISSPDASETASIQVARATSPISEGRSNRGDAG